MPALGYRIVEVRAVIVTDLSIGINLAVFQLLWPVLSGRLLESRGAIIPALAASGLKTDAIGRAWSAQAYGVSRAE